MQFGGRVKTQHTATYSQQANDAFELQMRAVGIVVLHAGLHGKIAASTPDWFTDLLCKTPMLQRIVQANVRTWTEENNMQCTQVCTGLWVAPMQTSGRRRTSECGIGVFVTDEFCDGESFHAICQASNADVTMIRDLIASTNPMSTKDVARMASLFQMAWNASVQNEESKTTVESVGQELADSYEEISMLYTMTSSMNSVNHPERFIELACSELLQTLPYEWIGVQLTTGDRLPKPGDKLVVASNEQLQTEELQQSVSSLLMTVEPGKTQIANGDDALTLEFGPATLVEPILKEGAVVGVLVAANKQGEDNSASSVDIKLLSATAAQLGIFIENALLYEDLNATFLGTLEALTNSIDAKDKYTCGHSQRVALLTAQLATAAGLDPDQVNRCRIAGLVHDIGKIGVPESVLLKKGGLTDDEFASIQKHPEIGAKILQEIPQMEDILGGVLHHHEKYDGSGYPHGIAGEDIPMIARLISLADTFDAMSSTRTYRNAMTRQSVLDELSRVSGTQFDPELTDLFVKLDFSEWEMLMIDHQSSNKEVPITLKEAS